MQPLPLFPLCDYSNSLPGFPHHVELLNLTLASAAIAIGEEGTRYKGYSQLSMVSQI
jgi:hypothetical protein